MSNKLYNYYLGNKYSKSLFKTSEPKSTSKYVYYKQNSYSSIIYILNSIYILNNIYHNEFKFFSLYFALMSFFLGIVSFLWWASQREKIHMCDVISYSNFIPLIGFYKLLNYFPNYEFLFISILITYSFYIKCLFKKNNIYKIKLLNIISGFFTFLVLATSKNNIMNLLILLSSLCFKFNDTLNIISYKYIASGTAWFHILSGISYLLIWKS